MRNDFVFKIEISLIFLWIRLMSLFTRDILTHNIAIKRYCDKKIFLSHGYLKGKVSSYLKVRYILF